MTKWEEDLYPKDDHISGWRVFFVMLCLVLGTIFSIFVANLAHGEEASCQYPASLITDALKDEPDRLVKKLEGADLSAFLSKMMAGGYFSGTLYKVDTIYIIKGKLLAGYHTAIDILFFVENGCVVGKVYGTASIVESLL